MSSAQPRLILVCGPSGCGKTTVANELAEELGNAVIIHQDDYFDQPFLDYAERTDDSFESPSSVKWKSLLEEVAAARISGKSVIVEGHVVVTALELADAADFAVVLDENEETCCARRLGRRARPGDENAILERYIREVVWPAYSKYGCPAQDVLATRLGPKCVRLSKLHLDAGHKPGVIVQAALDALNR